MKIIKIKKTKKRKLKWKIKEIKKSKNKTKLKLNKQKMKLKKNNICQLSATILELNLYIWHYVALFQKINSYY